MRLKVYISELIFCISYPISFAGEGTCGENPWLKMKGFGSSRHMRLSCPNFITYFDVLQLIQQTYIKNCKSFYIEHSHICMKCTENNILVL